MRDVNIKGNNDEVVKNNDFSSAKFFSDIKDEFFEADKNVKQKLLNFEYKL